MFSAFPACISEGLKVILKYISILISKTGNYASHLLWEAFLSNPNKIDLAKRFSIFQAFQGNF